MHIFGIIVEERIKEEVKKRPRLFLSALLVFLIVLARVIGISWTSDKSASERMDRCILLIGGINPKTLVEYYHPTTDECDMKSIGRMSTARINETHFSSGCYLSDTQQIVIREGWHYDKPPMIYGLRDASAKQLPFPYKNSSGSQKAAYTWFSTAASISPSKCLSCGGWDMNDLGECYQFDSSSPNKWTHIVSLHDALFHAASVLLNTNSYYISGGQNHDGEFKELHRYSISERKWYNDMPMAKERCLHSAAVISPTEFVVCGGACGGEEYRKDCEVCNATQNRWRPVGDLNFRRQVFAMVNFNGNVYAMGGTRRRGSSGLDSVERYDKQTERWTVVKALKNSRIGFIAVVI